MPPLLWVFSLLGLVLGFLGFSDLRPEASIASRLYLTLQLLTLESGALDQPPPLSLEVARWLAPISTIGGLLVWMSARTRRALDAARARWWMRGHAIMVGVDETGLVLARDFVRSGIPVVILDFAARPRLIRERGILHLSEDPKSKESLKRFGLRRASMVLTASDDDEDNLAAALSIGTQSMRPIQILARVEDPRLASSMTTRHLRRHNLSEALGLKTYNHHTNAARSLLQHLPIELTGFGGPTPRLATQVHVVISDASRQSEELILQFARLGHFAACGPVTIHAVFAGASAFLSNLAIRRGAIGACCLTEAHDVSPTETSDWIASMIRAGDPESAWTVLPEFTDRPGSITKLLQLAAAVDPNSFERLTCVIGPGHGSLDSVLRNTELAQIVHPMPDVKAYAGVESVLRNRLDCLARSIHESWLQRERAQLVEAEALGNHDAASLIRAKAAFVEWDSLREDLRDANRAQADSIWSKVRYAALAADLPDLWTAYESILPELDESLQVVAARERKVAGLLDTVAELWLKLPTEVVEPMAEAEHRRWCAQRWLDGWTFGPERNDARKVHNDLVDYGALAEATKQRDRDAVRRVPMLMRAMLLPT